MLGVHHPSLPQSLLISVWVRLIALGLPLGKKNVLRVLRDVLFEMVEPGLLLPDDSQQQLFKLCK